MNKKFIYLAGPIAGCNKGEANDWRKYVQENLSEGIVGISPLRCEPMIGRKYKLVYDDPRFGTPKAISGKNWYDTNNCDLVLAYLPKEINDRRPSYGTVIEIGWAIGLRKPIVLVTDDKKLADHPLIQANINWVLEDLDTAMELIEGIFMDYVND